ncbi:dynein axonemal heavy chain 3-like [Penaeus japonicus]|uniref:dynein axonemal heavy chain 3-like n=1 Tax=Penaeus japonicus TaxID=27405 RepID=UPI001C714B74|nr:dynein axonemal heavy chain 3-like [Penaeus japonicus]
MNEKATLSSKLDARCTLKQQYAHYLAQGIKTPQMTSPPANLLKVVTMDVDKSMLRNIRFRLVVSELVEELRDCFYQGARSAILKYALRCPAVRARLGIGVAPLSHEPLVVRAPVPWHQSFLTGAHHCYHNLFALNHILNRLDTIWEERFIDMAALVGKGDLLAPTPEALEEAVRAQCAETRRILLQKWLPAVARVFGDLMSEWRSLVPTDVADSLRQVRRFFSAVRSRMSLQLRRLVLDSICDLRDALIQKFKIIFNTYKYFLFVCLTELHYKGDRTLQRYTTVEMLLKLKY